MFSIDGTFLVIFLSFLLFMVVMRQIFFDPLMQLKEERRETIEEGLKGADDALSKTSQLSEECMEKLAEAKRNAQRLIQEKREWVKGNAASHLTETREKALSNYERQAILLKEREEQLYHQLQAERDEFINRVVDKLSEQPRSVAGQSASSALL